MFLFAGTGYNIVQYCCSDCETEGVEAIADMSCESIHEQHCHDTNTTHTHSFAMETCVHELAKGCDLDRLSVDIPLIEKSNTDFIDYALLCTDLADYQTTLVASSELSSGTHIAYLPPENSYPQAGRQILSKISILII